MRHKLNVSSSTITVYLDDITATMKIQKENEVIRTLQVILPSKYETRNLKSFPKPRPNFRFARHKKLLKGLLNKKHTRDYLWSITECPVP